MAMKKTEEVTIRSFEQLETKIRIVGDSPLIVHNWDEKAKKEMLDKQTGKDKTKKKPCRMPFDDFAKALYWITDMPTEVIKDPLTNENRDVVTEALFDKAIENGAKFGFPVSAFKLAGNSAAYRMGWVKNQMALRGAYFLKSDYGELTWIQGCVPELREDPVKINMSTDLRYRPMFSKWYCDLTLSINTGFGMTFNDIINVINAGGAGVGVGEWRPERDGIFGTYHVEIVK
jgi:hypothetical protein